MFIDGREETGKVKSGNAVEMTMLFLTLPQGIHSTVPT